MKKNSTEYNGMMADIILSGKHDLMWVDELTQETKPSRLERVKQRSKNKDYDVGFNYTYKNLKKSYN